MLGYILLFLAIVFSYNIKNKKKQLLFVFVAVTIFSGLRYGIGYDYYSYLDSCMQGSSRADRYEPIPRMFAMWSQQTTPYLFFVLTSLFISVFYYIGIKKGGHDFFCEAIFYICFPFLFFNQLGIVRQAMASSVVFCAIAIGNKYSFSIKNPIVLKKIFLLLIGYLCHQSALVAVFILFPWDRVNKFYLWIIFIASFFVGIAITPLLESLLYTGFLGEDATASAIRYLENETTGEGRLIKYLIYLVALLSLLLYDRLTKMNDKNAYYIGLLVFGAALYALFVFNASLAKRFCIFFFSSSIFMVPLIVKVLKIDRLLYVVVMMILLSLQIYISSSNIRVEDKNGSSVSYPYRTFIDEL